jgi:hypothetical protein
MPSYEREAQALREKTERLRALRLARDGAETVAPAAGGGAAKPRGGKAAPRGKASKAGGNLSEWLKTQQDQGRRS